MIYLDVFVPAVSQKIEVRADETRNIGQFKEEICLLMKKLLQEEEEYLEGFELYDDLRKEVLPEDLTLAECGISGGSSLIFI